jgi:dipeptidase E
VPVFADVASASPWPHPVRRLTRVTPLTGEPGQAEVAEVDPFSQTNYPLLTTSTTSLWKDNMKLLLTDSGIRNASIQDALVDLLGKPVAEANALCIPTAGYGGPYGDPGGPWRFTSGRSPSPMTGLGWKSVGTLELTALPSIDKERWVSWVREADVLLVNGGDTQYLGRWMRESGLADLLPSLPDTVYVGLSAGSRVMTPASGRSLWAGNLPPAATAG